MAAITPDVGRDRRFGPNERRRNAAVTHVNVSHPMTLEGIRVSWGGIWGGVLTAVGLLLLLAALGAAIGISAANPQSTDVQTVGIAAGVWAGVSLLIALFVGGLVSTRIGATFDGATGFWEGALVWVVTLLLMAYLATTSLATLTGGAMKVMGAAAQTAATAVQGTPQANNAVNQAQNQVRNGSAASMVDQLKSKLSQARANGTIQQKAAQAKPAASKALWGAFVALVLSLVAAVLGAMAGRRRYPINP